MSQGKAVCERRLIQQNYRDTKKPPGQGGFLYLQIKTYDEIQAGTVPDPEFLVGLPSEESRNIHWIHSGLLHRRYCGIASSTRSHDSRLIHLM